MSVVSAPPSAFRKEREDERKINSPPLLSVCSSASLTRTRVKHKREESSEILHSERAN